MSVWSVVILLLLGVFIHGNFAINCYECESEQGEFCDNPGQPVDESIGGVRKVTCLNSGAVCGTLSWDLTGMQISYVTQKQRSLKIIQWVTLSFRNTRVLHRSYVYQTTGLTPN